VLLPKELIPLIVILPAAFVLLLVGLPFFDRGKERNPFERPLVMIPGLLVIAFILILTLLGSGRLFTL
jgi:quinol-cytochrome oxidoreductase complex cytochrome b subunit